MKISINNKQCTRCKEFLPIEDFYLSTRGYTSKCKPCTIEYNTENRNKNGPRRPKKKLLQTDLHRKLISDLGPGNSMFLGRYVHGYKKFSLYRGPWGCVLDGELLYGLHTDDDLIYTLQQRHMKLMSRSDSDISLDEMLNAISLVRNSCGVPIEARFLKGLVSLDQYFLWMDVPRKLLISEVADQVSIDLEILKLLLPEKTAGNQKSSLPGNIKNTDNNSPQVIDNTPDPKSPTIEFVEE